MLALSFYLNVTRLLELLNLRDMNHVLRSHLNFNNVIYVVIVTQMSPVVIFLNIFCYTGTINCLRRCHIQIFLFQLHNILV